MLLIDSNQLFISLIIQSKNPDSENFIKHVVLNSLRANVKKFKDYGEVVLCSDSRQYGERTFSLIIRHIVKNPETNLL